jgi:hypothetical protein
MSDRFLQLVGLKIGGGQRKSMGYGNMTPVLLPASRFTQMVTSWFGPLIQTLGRIAGENSDPQQRMK